MVSAMTARLSVLVKRYGLNRHMTPLARKIMIKAMMAEERLPKLRNVEKQFSVLRIKGATPKTARKILGLDLKLPHPKQLFGGKDAS